jgi:hypothetical protein|tara:strand:- start:602 stop:952 length:351 start_codon:yes stop_codon:yes gene_type:complete
MASEDDYTVEIRKHEDAIRAMLPGKHGNELTEVLLRANSIRKLKWERLGGVDGEPFSQIALRLRPAWSYALDEQRQRLDIVSELERCFAAGMREGRRRHDKPDPPRQLPLFRTGKA